ncbi:hypothetical protein K504DRAFT_461321 [Pleomassaria siparia CBS 279.74]|uniref:Mediator of RNA polymerase II transcription subunit 16 n=1 Tax=Pleomassaria siparia CBS 279.74 TaxID=1314801 RepID=A0A6G1JVC1_9PLEO|nr:hypothetical protein K504DRAFT_461321 [Pleomassaria siparia CBS 279.74]
MSLIMHDMDDMDNIDNMDNMDDMNGQAYMDHGDNIDDMDLFGDSEQVSLPPLPPLPQPITGLARRLDDLSSSGCCQKIAWSKNGCVAYITPDGYAINLRVFCRDVHSGKWHLGKDTRLDTSPANDDFPFVHLSWSHLGNELAILDSAGHVYVFSCSPVLDRMTQMRADSTQPEADGDAIVGMHWLAILPYEQKNHIAWSATGQGDKWEYKINSHIFHDAHHPVEGKASFICLKKHGELKLRFQQPDGSWSESSSVLGPMISTRQPFTHAAFASNNDNTLLLAAYDVSDRLHLYRVEAKWNIPPTKPGHQAKYFEKPDLHVSEIDVVDSCYPVSSPVVNGDIQTGSETSLQLPAQLTHLHFLPITPEKGDGTYPTIQAIFSTPPNIVNFDQAHTQQTPCSIVVRWDVHHTQQNQLHSSLDKVTSKKKTISSVPGRSVFSLKRVPDTVMHSVILAFFPLWYNMRLAFCYSDGTIEFRNRSTMEPISPDYDNTGTVTSLSRAGFSFPLDPTLHISLSPNHCMAACMNQDGQVKTRSVEYNYGTLSTDEEDARHSAALAALVLQFSSTANQYFSSDDIFAIIGELSEKRKRDFIYLMFQGLQLDVDCGIDDTTTPNKSLILLGRTPFFVKTLSAAHLLGLQGSVNRSVTSKIAWMILNIKYITQILTTIMRMHGQIEKNPLRPEVVPQFVGICRWIMQFMIYMIDEITAVGYELQNNPPTTLDRATLEAKIHEMNKPAIILLLCSFPRMMMKAWATPLAWVIRTAVTYSNSSPTADVRRIYAPLNLALSETPFDWRLFEGVVSEAQLYVRACYIQQNLSEAARNECERELILGRIPETLMPAAKRLLTDTLFNDKHQNGCLMDKIDLSKVWFFDTTWLGLENSRKANEWFETHIVDTCQKMVIRGTGTQTHATAPSSNAQVQATRNRSDSIGGQAGVDETADKKKKKKASGKSRLRRCTRCGAYMEDVVQNMPGYTFYHISWLMGVAKHCICGNSWMLGEEKPRAK